MFNSKFNLYHNEWLNVVFANRNQAYGAYELRKNYSSTLAKSLFVAIAFFVLLVCSPLIYKYFKTEPLIEPPLVETGDPVKIVEVNIHIPKKTEHLSASKGQANPVKPKSVAWTTPEVVDQELVTHDVPKMDELMKSTIGPVSADGTEGLGNAMDGLEGKGGNGITGIPGNSGSDELVNIAVLQQEPMFPGGMEAFVNFLRKNLRYPSSASDNGVSGKVFLNFIIERDGSLTDIKVIRGIGFGCDEEAVRVLKKSPRWAPGIQHEQRVRVMYTIPIVFAMN